MQKSLLSLLLALCVLTAVQGGKTCTKPGGNNGESYIEGCLKMTCKAGVWRTSLDTSLCCYDMQPYHPNTIITATENGCVKAAIHCRQEDDVATAVLQVDNNCGEHSTREQVQEIKHLLVKHIEQAGCEGDAPTPTITAETTTNPTQGAEGILVSGGWQYLLASMEYVVVLESVELYIPETGKTCNITSLPAPRQTHSMNMVGDAAVVCGGLDKNYLPTKTCLHLSPPSSLVWTDYATTAKQRYLHTGWAAPSGELLLVGGDGSNKDAEVVSLGASTGGIRLQHTTMGNCAIDAADSVIVTGGHFNQWKVDRYNLHGHVENLPNMNDGRGYHGCGSFISEGTTVLIVAGGKSFYGNGDYSSTERMAIGAAAWTTVNPLPRALHHMASATVGNLVYLTGGTDEKEITRSEVLVFDGENWREAGRLQTSRTEHAATKITTASFMQFCN